MKTCQSTHHLCPTWGNLLQLTRLAPRPSQCDFTACCSGDTYVCTYTLCHDRACQRRVACGHMSNSSVRPHASFKLLLFSFILDKFLLLLLCQFFISKLYAIKVIVVAYTLLAYNIVFFKIAFNVFPRPHLLNHFSQTWPEAQTYADVVREIRVSHGWLVC